MYYNDYLFLHRKAKNKYDIKIPPNDIICKNKMVTILNDILPELKFGMQIIVPIKNIKISNTNIFIRY